MNEKKFFLQELPHLGSFFCGGLPAVVPSSFSQYSAVFFVVSSGSEEGVPSRVERPLTFCFLNLKIYNLPRSLG